MKYHTLISAGLLWFVQYSMFHFIEKFTPTMAVANTCVGSPYALSVVFTCLTLTLLQTLFLVGTIPFAAEILSIFSDEVHLVYTSTQPHNDPLTHTLRRFRRKPFWVLTSCCPSECSASWPHLLVCCSCSSGVWLTITSEQLPMVY